MTRTGAQLVVDQLVAEGAETAFCVPGESYIGILDALRDAPIRLVVARHEAGAANMAEAAAKLTGRPGVCFVTRAPGATHASVGIHTAYQDSTPLVLFVGQVPRSHLGREAFQELDYARVFGQMAKRIVQPETADELPRAVARAFHVAASERPGPVVVALPEDVQAERSERAAVAPLPPVRPAADADAVARALELLEAAERPLAVVGGGGWSEAAARDVREFAEASSVPVVASFRRQDYVDNRSPAYAGVLTIGMNPALARRVQDADVLLALGTRLGEVATQGWSLVEPREPRQRLIHVHADADELGRVYDAEVAVHADSSAFAAALRPVDGGRRRAWFESSRADFVESLRPAPAPGALNLADVLADVRARLPDDGVLTNGAGNYTVWCHRFFEFRRYRTQLAPCSGAMGYGVPAAVAAKVVRPESEVVCVSGDGDFLMSGHEVAAAVQERAPIVVLVVNNGMYGTIRMHQERNFPGRVVGTDLLNPDFVALARAFGGYGERVERTADFASAFERALEADAPALLELVVDAEAITPRATLTEIRAGALSENQRNS